MGDGSPISRGPLRLLMYGAWRASPCFPVCSRRLRAACHRPGPPPPLPHRPRSFASWRRDAALAALASTGWLLRMDASRSARAHLSMPLSIAVSGDAAKSATGWSASGVVNDAPEGAVRLRISSSDELSRGSVVRSMGRLRSFPTARGDGRGSCAARSVSSPFAASLSSAWMPPCSIRFGRPCSPSSSRSATMLGLYVRASCAGTRRTCRAARHQRCFPYAG